ncbi:hypothetical protein GOV05_05515 [Candidatus Woesearchaeota archaeon]|nr:hypothetical protein [Candidatus Woesearchaeota archaeon]
MVDQQIKEDGTVVVGEKISPENNSEYEEIEVIRKKIKKKNHLEKLFIFIWKNNLLLFILALLVAGYVVQTEGIYDIKGTFTSMIDDFNFLKSQTDELKIVEDDISQEETSTKDDITVTDETGSDIERILDNPTFYNDSIVFLEGGIQEHQTIIGTEELTFIIIDKNKNYIPIKTEKAGFNPYGNYKLRGVVTIIDDKVFIDSSNYYIQPS